MNYGFVDQTLTSKNAVLPILYHIHHNNYSGDFDSQVKYDSDRLVIKRWLHLVLLKQIFGASADTVLRRIRAELEKKTDFPAKNIVSSFAGTNKDMSFDDDAIENILKTQKDQSAAFSILALLYPNLDYKNGNFHKDHLHPAVCFQDDYLDRSRISETELDFYKNQENWNSIRNLQLLDANENMSKNAGELKPWAEAEIKKSGMTMTQFCNQHLMPEVLEFSEFKQFITERKLILKNEIKKQTTF